MIIKTFNNDNLIKYIKVETNLEVSFKSLLAMEEENIDYILKFIFELGKRKEVKETNPDLKKKTLFSDRLNQYNLNYQKPNPNKRLDFPSSIVPMHNQTQPTLENTSQISTLSPKNTMN